MCSCVFKFFLIFHFFLTYFNYGSIDINLAEFQYIADHLSEKECHKLVAALHFHSFELPKDINAAERRIPEDIPCLDLLLHWNSAYREGKGETHTEVCHRLNQIGRPDLAQWLSKTVFHELSKDLKVGLAPEKNNYRCSRPPAFTKMPPEEKIKDEEAWWKIDSLLAILIVFGIICLITGAIFQCILYYLRKMKCQHKYEKLNDRGAVK